MDNPIIQLRHLTKHYGDFKAVKGLDLTINKGEIFGLLGPNGAGKTTTILMMMGLTEPTSGTAQVCGFDASRDPISVKRLVGYMPDSVGFYDNMTALENLMYIGELNGIPRAEVENRALTTMDLVGLQGDAIHKKTSAYSRGMKQRLGLAEVLIKEPKVIVLDEPTLGIDPSGVREFLSLIMRLSREKGLTVLLSSHHLHQVQQVCDRVGIFVNGELLVEGDINSLSSQLFAEKSYEIHVSLEETISLPWKDETEMLQMPSVQSVSAVDQRIAISCKVDVTPDVVRFFVHRGYGVTGVQKKEYGLEDIYQKYFEDSKFN
ncbi:ABC-2 type transport system ATP-binding protein [Cyclobacterium lianum]|uniref:ABC-2 type transport system ATP-binding protein n=1 Tax=Cyclobacterium lianum TaxID=388280 RepID=A0A1M7PC30_9BACT|nr:ABC transporter ATP-binding protein [Cyclobacterium lianum]SHN14430.1 ABC-2 type transport system ATP-binding protein [Cyclobacterium lianum]